MPHSSAQQGMHGHKGPAHGCYPLTQPPAQERSLQQLAEANQQPQVPLEEVEAKVSNGSMDDAAVDKLKMEAHSQPQPQVPQHDEYDKATLQHLQAGASQPHGTQGVLATKMEALAVPPEVPQAEQEVRPCPASLHIDSTSRALRNRLSFVLAACVSAWP